MVMNRCFALVLLSFVCHFPLLGQLASPSETKNTASTSLSSIMLTAFKGKEVAITDNLWSDVSALVDQLRPEDRQLVLSSIEITGEETPVTPTQKFMTVEGKPIGLILGWIAEYHAAGMSFDGAVTKIRFVYSNASYSRRWYAPSPALIKAFSLDGGQLGNDKEPILQALHAVKTNSAHLFEGVRVVALDKSSGRIQLTGNTSTLDDLDRWLTVEFLKLSAADAVARDSRYEDKEPKAKDDKNEKSAPK